MPHRPVTLRQVTGMAMAVWGLVREPREGWATCRRRGAQRGCEIRAAGRRARLEERPATPRRSPRPVRDFRPYAQDSDSLPPRSPRGAESTEVAPAGTEEVSLQRRRLLPAAYQPHDLGTATGESQSPADGESLAEFPGSRSAAADPELDLRTRQSEWDLDPEVGVHVVGASQADVWPQDHNVRWR